MASYYVYSGAAGAGTGADWANAFTTLTAALSGKAAGDFFYIAHDHNEATAGNVTLTSPGTAATPCYFLAVNRSGTVPPVAADLDSKSALITTTGNTSISIAGSVISYGVIYHAGVSGATTAGCAMNVGGTAASYQLFLSGSMRMGSGTGGGFLNIGANAAQSYVEFYDTTVQFNVTSQTITNANNFRWVNTPSAVSGAALPTTLFTQVNARGGRSVCRGVDFSALGSGKTIVGATAGGIAVRYEFDDCKFEADCTRATTPVMGSGNVVFSRCGETGNSNSEAMDNLGTLTTELTVVRTGGATDGTTPIAWKIVTTATCEPCLPFESQPIAIWNSTTGSAVNVAVQGIWGGGAVPDDDEIWLEVEYLGDASSPLASFANDGLATVLTAPASQSAASETWGGSTTDFKLDVSVTPQQAGLIIARVKCGVASSTFYVDPKITLS